MAKRYRNLFGTLVGFRNLFSAYRGAARGKRGQEPVAAFEMDLEGNLLRLQEELGARTYRPGAYASFYIRDPKHRLISAAPFRDRVVHHALVNVLEPIFERTFLPDSYANRVGKGTHKALDRAQGFARRYPYVLQCDVEKFFPSIDHTVLRGILARKIADEGVLWLVDQILESGRGVLDHEYSMVYFPGDDLFAILRPRGLPIGNLTSQFWANVYLNELDQLFKRRLGCRANLRYVDDTLLFSDSKRQLWGWKREIRSFLATLRLTLHERSSTVYPVSHGIPFLGFQVFVHKRRLKRRNVVGFSRRLRRAARAVERGEIPYAKLFGQIQGWLAHASHGDTLGLQRSLLSRPLPLTPP